MNNNSIDLLEFTINLAKEAGQLMINYRQSGNLSTECKTPRDLVTKADLECEKLIVSKVRHFFPDDQILAEEGYNTVEYPSKSDNRL